MTRSSFASALAPIVLPAYGVGPHPHAPWAQGCPDTDGSPLRLGSFWESTPAVVVFLRHYG